MISPGLCPICKVMLLDVLPGGQTLSTGLTHALFLRPSWTPATFSHVKRPIARSNQVGRAQEERNVDAA